MMKGASVALKAALGFALFVLGGCAGALPGAPRIALAKFTGTGAVRFTLASGRSVQYVSSQVADYRLDLTNQATGQAFSKHYSGGGQTLSWTCLNLPDGAYRATVTAFADRQDQVAIGQSSTAFTVTADSTTAAGFAPIRLAATPVGDWQVTTDVRDLPDGYHLEGLAFTLKEGDGTLVTRTLATHETSRTNDWSQVVALPGASTTLVVVATARDAEGAVMTASGEVAAVMASDSTVRSTLEVSFGSAPAVGGQSEDGSRQ